MTEKEELLPCPFCGYALPLEEGLCIAKVDEFGDEVEEAQWQYTGICCANCAAFVVGDGISRDEAIAAWNHRTPPAPSPPPAKKVGPTTNAAAFELSIYEGVRDRLARLTAGTCSCNTKSPELRYHSERCHYRVAREALDLLLAAPPPPAKEAE